MARGKAAARGARAAARAGGRARGERGGDSGQQETVLSFRVDHHLAEALNKLPDRSDFIRRAILRAFYRVCPACHGKGVLPETAARPIEGFMSRNLATRCSCCGFSYPAEDLVPTAKRGVFLCKDCKKHDEDPDHIPGNCG